MHKRDPTIPLKKTHTHTHTNMSEHETGGREGHRLRVFENRVLREMCGFKWEAVTGDCRELHKAELCDIYYS
jgi:hypothetical protein